MLSCTAQTAECGEVRDCATITKYGEHTRETQLTPTYQDAKNRMRKMYGDSPDYKVGL